MWLTALLLGFAGSLHCVGMCSPLVMAVSQLRKPFIFNRLAYNIGRVLTYGILGAAVSSVGVIFPMSGFQNIFSIALGGVLVLLGIGGIGGFRIPLITDAVQRLTTTLKVLFQKFLQRRTYTSMVALGSLNGLLPCGLTYLALTYCLTLQGPIDGFNFMLLFGVGTLPVMIGLTSVLSFVGKFIRFNSARLTTIIFIVLGSLLIARVVVQHKSLDSSPEEATLCIEEKS